MERANSTAGKASIAALYSETALLKKRRAAASLFSTLASSGLELLEIGVGLEVGIGLAQSDETPERAGERALGGGLLGRAARSQRRVAGLDHGLERRALMAGIALHRLDEVRDEVVALLELHVDVRISLRDALSQRDEAVVDDDEIEDECDQDREKDPFHAASPCDRL